MPQRSTIATLLLVASSALASPRGLVSPRTIVRHQVDAKHYDVRASAHQDSFVVLGPIVPASYGLAAFGDTDHDGFREIMMVVDAIDSMTLRTLEVEGDGIYREVLSVADYVYPYATGDLDQDGKSEIVGQASFSIEILESQSPSLHPTISSWSSPPLSNIIGFSSVADTDRDGNLEIIHSVNPSRLIIYENSGNDSFVEKYFYVGPFQDQGNKVIADFDGDGLIEIAVSGHNGHLQVFESPADDTWNRIYFESTGLANAYGIAGGLDTNGNGRPELFLVGDDWPEFSDPTRAIYIYEAPSNDSFVRVATLSYDDEYTGGLFNAVEVADFDASGQPEAVIKFFRQLLVCRAISPGQWILNPCATDPSPNGIHSHIQADDVNLNGRPEIFWLANTSILASSLVLEHPGVSPTDARGLDARKTGRLDVTPNPARGQAEIVLTGPAVAARSLSVFDAAGRLVVRQPLPHQALRRFLWSSLPSQPGMYFLRVEDAAGQTISTGRATIVR